MNASALERHELKRAGPRAAEAYHRPRQLACWQARLCALFSSDVHAWAEPFALKAVFGLHRQRATALRVLGTSLLSLALLFLLLVFLTLAATVADDFDGDNAW